jgi:RNA polymerase sigma factor (sigma-70 family)
MSVTGTSQAEVELLRRFVKQRDDEAFAEFVRVYGPLVFSVCYRVLGNRADAEDASQAVFLTVAQKAESLAGMRCLESWLHHVSHQVAISARRMRARQATRDARLGSETGQSAQPSDPAEHREFLLTIDDEVAALPAKYREPFILHHLQNITKTRTAEILNQPEGRISMRLHRAREILKDRLAQKGLVFSAGSLLTAVQRLITAPEFSPAFISTTAKAATLVAAGHEAGGLVSIFSQNLAKGAVKMLLMAKLKAVAFWLFGLLLLTGSIAQMTLQGAEQNAAKGAALEKPQPAVGVQIDAPIADDFPAYAGHVISEEKAPAFAKRTFLVLSPKLVEYYDYKNNAVSKYILNLEKRTKFDPPFKDASAPHISPNERYLVYRKSEQVYEGIARSGMGPAVGETSAMSITLDEKTSTHWSLEYQFSMLHLLDTQGGSRLFSDKRDYLPIGWSPDSRYCFAIAADQQRPAIAILDTENKEAPKFFGHWSKQSTLPKLPTGKVTWKKSPGTTFSVLDIPPPFKFSNAQYKAGAVAPDGSRAFIAVGEPEKPQQVVAFETGKDKAEFWWQSTNPEEEVGEICALGPNGILICTKPAYQLDLNKPLVKPALFWIKKPGTSAIKLGTDTFRLRRQPDGRVACDVVTSENKLARYVWMPPMTKLKELPYTPAEIGFAANLVDTVKSIMKIE